MARRDREINIFNIAFLDVITGAMGAFVLLVVLLSANLKKAEQQTEPTKQQQEQAQATNNNTNNNEDLRERLRQALNEIENLKGRLQQALDAARRAREQVAGLETVLKQAAPVPDYWAVIDVILPPTCKTIFNPQIYQIVDKLPDGFTDRKNAGDFVDRNSGSLRLRGKFNDTRQTFFVSFPSGNVGRFLFGVQMSSPLPEGCQFQTDIWFTSQRMPFSQHGVTDSPVTPSGNPVLLAAFPANGLSVTPSPDDVAAWQKAFAAPNSGAKK